MKCNLKILSLKTMKGMIMKKILFGTLSLFAVAVLAADVETIFPDGALDQPSDKVAGVIVGNDNKAVQGQDGFEKIAVFESKGGVNNSGCVKVTIDPAILGKDASHNCTGLYIILSKSGVKKITVTFDAKWGNAEGGTVTVGRLWGGAEPIKLTLTGEWQKQEVELSSAATLGEVIFTTLYGADGKGGTFYLDNINVKEVK